MFSVLIIAIPTMFILGIMGGSNLKSDTIFGFVMLALLLSVFAYFNLFLVFCFIVLMIGCTIIYYVFKYISAVIKIIFTASNSN